LRLGCSRKPSLRLAAPRTRRTLSCTLPQGRQRECVWKQGERQADRIAGDEGRRWIVMSGRIGKRHSTIWNGERTGETARLGAHEALPHTPPGDKPPETPGPLSLRSDCMDREGSVKGSLAAPKNGAPLTDPSRSGTGSLDEGKGAPGPAAGLCPTRWSAPKSGFKLERGDFCLTKTTFSWKAQRVLARLLHYRGNIKPCL
jgi:hypothetical protein